MESDIRKIVTWVSLHLIKRVDLNRLDSIIQEVAMNDPPGKAA